MTASLSRKLALSAAGVALAFGVAAQAAAGTYVSVGYSSPGYHHGYYPGYYHAGYYSYGHHYRGHPYRGHYGHHYHHGHGGGKAAAIALGVVGGAILLNELAEDRARDRYYEDRYYQDRARGQAYSQGYNDGRDDAQRYDDSYQDDGAYYEDDSYEDDGELAGGPSDAAPAPARISAAAAYQTCIKHARRALGERGFVISVPYRPDTVEDRGGALLMTATVTAQRGPESWSRAMSCEASETRVYRMELI